MPYPLNPGTPNPTYTATHLHVALQQNGVVFYLLGFSDEDAFAHRTNWNATSAGTPQEIVDVARIQGADGHLTLQGVNV
jgi:hypothetical protein